MLKFVKHHMDTIAGIEIYPLISFVIFFTFFCAVAAYVIWQRKEHFTKMSLMPLDDNEVVNSKTITQ
ncbi:MAG: CcoQ/FixQ family Cbb3-type cytochrome c oxidase assembly chaperone [Flavobacteriales bacterium]|nr:CcoQ/FixQ family Cbb3-type cytochrome c oxidase assembly chaperone [Flavobacteriales bacterium]